MTNLEIVAKQGDVLATALTTLNNTQEAYNTNFAIDTELRRQLAYHQSTGDQSNANIVAGQLAPIASKTIILKFELDKAKNSYGIELAKYAELKNQLLSAEEKIAADIAQKALNEKNIRDAAAATEKMKAEQEAAKLKSEKSNYAASSTKYIIWGIVFVVIIIAGIVIYRISKKAPAPLKLAA